jgi:hypothetical protein
MSDILSRLAERALGSPVCLAHRVRYRFAPAEVIEGWPEAGDGEVPSGEIATGNEHSVQPLVPDQRAASVSESPVQIETGLGSPPQMDTGDHALRSTMSRPERPGSAAVGEPPVAAEAPVWRPSGRRPTPERGNLADRFRDRSAPTDADIEVQPETGSGDLSSGLPAIAAGNERPAEMPALDRGAAPASPPRVQMQAGPPALRSTMPRPEPPGSAAVGEPPVAPEAPASRPAPHQPMPERGNLADRVRNRSALTDPDIDARPEVRGGEAPARPSEITLGHAHRVQPPARDQRAASASDSPVQMQTGHHVSRSNVPRSNVPTSGPPAPAAATKSSIASQPPVASEATVSREAADASTPGRGRASSGSMLSPAIRGGGAAMSPPSVQARLPPITQRVANPAAMSREAEAAPDDAGKVTLDAGPTSVSPVGGRIADPAALSREAATTTDARKSTSDVARESGSSIAQNESRSAMRPLGRDRTNVTTAEISDERRITPATIHVSRLVSDESNRQNEISAAAQPMRAQAGTFPRTAPLAAASGDGMRAPVTQLRAEPGSPHAPKATTARRRPADQVEAVSPTSVAGPTQAAERSHRSSIERSDTPPERQMVGPQPSPLRSSAQPMPHMVEVPSPGRQAARLPSSLSERMVSGAVPSRLAAPRFSSESNALPAQSVSGASRRRATESPATPTSPEIHIDIGRIQIELPRSPPQARRPRPQPPPLQGKPRGGPDG